MSRMPVLVLISVLIALAAQGPLLAQQDPQAAEVRQAIRDSYEYARTNLKDAPNPTSKDGSVGFWSSGGLIQYVPADTPAAEYVVNTLRPKHIRVIVLADGVAVANFYVEGAVHQKDGAPIPNYLTRVTQVMVKEDGAWKVRSDHFSAVIGGRGTDATALP